MKEITTEVTLKLTFIEKVPDSMADYHIETERSLEAKRKYEKMVAKELVADKADICGIRHFVMDVDHEVFFDDSDNPLLLLHPQRFNFPEYPSIPFDLDKFLSVTQYEDVINRIVEERLKERCKL